MKALVIGLDHLIPNRASNPKIRKAISSKVFAVKKFIQLNFNFNKKSLATTDQAGELRYTQLRAELTTKCILKK